MAELITIILFIGSLILLLLAGSAVYVERRRDDAQSQDERAFKGRDRRASPR